MKTLSFGNNNLCLVVPGFAMSVMITANLLIMIAAVPQEDQLLVLHLICLQINCLTVGISLAGLIFSKLSHSQLQRALSFWLGDEHSGKVHFGDHWNAEKSSDYIKTAAEWVKPVLKTSSLCFEILLFSLLSVSLASSVSCYIAEEFNCFAK